MMKAEDLKNSVLQMAMQGKLVPQDPNDEPATVLLEKIKQEKEQLIKDKKLYDKSKPSLIINENNEYFEIKGRKKENISDEILFEIPSSWAYVRISSINDIYTGNSINKTEKENKYTGLSEGYNYIATKDVKFNNQIDYENGVKIPITIEKFKKAPKDSILLCIEGGSAGRKIGFTNEKVCFGNKLCCFNNLGLYDKFLLYYLQSPQFKEVFKSEISGIIGGVGVGKIRKMIISCPPYNEQKRIVEKLEQILPQIEQYGKYEKQLTKLNEEFPDKLKKSILQQAIQGKLVPQNPEDEPATVLLEKIKQEKEQLIKDKKIKRNKNESTIYKKDGHWYEVIAKNNEVKCIDNEIPFEIPESWYWTKMSNVIELISGRDLKKEEYNDRNEGIPYITGASNIKNNNLIINRWIKKPIVISTKNDLLLTCKGTVGKTIILQEDKVHIARQIMALHTFSENIDINYINIFINFYVNKLQEIAKSMIPGISREDVLNLHIPIPSLNEQKKIVEVIEKLIIILEVLLH